MRRLEVGFAAVVLAAAAVSVSVGAQEPSGKPGTTPSTAQQPGTERDKPTTPDRASAPRSDSRGFVDEMAIAGMAEVQLGKMAADRAASADVKSFGQMMVADHSKANDELKTVASQLNIQPTTQLDQKHRDLADKLSKLKGAEFDREYMTAMVQGHEEVLRKLQDRAGHQSPGSATPNRGGESDDPKGRDTTRGGPGAQPGQPGATRSSDGAPRAAGSPSGGAGDDALTQWAAKAAPTVQRHLERAKDIQQKVAK